MSDQFAGTNIRVEVVLAMPAEQALREIEMPAGSTIAEAIEQSGIVDLFDGFELDLNRVGVYGHKVKPDQVLSDGDRVEIYRPLIADPKEVRRQRAIRQSETKAAK